MTWTPRVVTGRSYPAEERLEELERENAALRDRVLRLETVLAMARMVMAQGCEGPLTVSTPRVTATRTARERPRHFADGCGSGLPSPPGPWLVALAAARLEVG